MNRQAILQYVDKKYQKKEGPVFRIGDTVRVSARITEGDTTRIQAFEGVVISFKGQGGARTFTVRKVSFGVGVERVFPLISPAIEKVTVIRSGHSRRAKLYYLRARVGRAARLEEKERVTETSKNSNHQKKVEPQTSEQVLVGAPNKS